MNPIFVFRAQPLAKRAFCFVTQFLTKFSTKFSTQFSTKFVVKPAIEQIAAVSVCLAMLLSSAAVAQPQTALEPVVVTATRRLQPISETLGDVTVIGAEQIRQSGARSVAQLLAQEAGVEIAETGGERNTTGLFLRGTKTAQSLLLIDGVAFENASSGGGAFEFIALESIDRIEVTRGPSSALYGSAAIGGVVQIFTRSGTRQSALVEFGSRNARRVRADFGLAQNGFSFSASAHHASTAGFDATLSGSSNAQVDNDGSRASGGSAKLGFANPQLAVNVQAIVNQGQSAYDDAFSTPETARLKFRSAATSADASYKLSDVWSAALKISRSAIEYEYFAFTYAPKAVTSAIELTSDFNFRIGAVPIQGVVGSLQQVQTVRGEGVSYAADKRTDRALWASLTAQVDAHRFKFQLRQDVLTAALGPKYEKTNAAAAWGYQISPQWQVSASAASAFRAPTFDDLYSPFGGNTLLRPETSKSIEFLVQHRTQSTEFVGSIFNQRIRDAIELDTNFTPQNSDRVKITGVSLRGALQTGPFKLRGQVTFQDPKRVLLDNSGQLVDTFLPRRARRHASATIDYAIGQWLISSDVRSQSARIDTDASTIAGYGVLGFAARYQVNVHWSAKLRINNLVDKTYATASGYRSEPRSAYLSLQWSGL